MKNLEEQINRFTPYVLEYKDAILKANAEV